MPQIDAMFPGQGNGPDIVELRTQAEYDKFMSQF